MDARKQKESQFFLLQDDCGKEDVVMFSNNKFEDRFSKDRLNLA